MALDDTVLARICAFPDAEIHLRRRVAPNPAIPDMFDWALYNVQGGGYTQALSFPITHTVLLGMIAALEAQVEELT